MDLHFYHHFPNPGTPDRFTGLLEQILTNQKTIMADLSTIQTQNTALLAAVKDEDTVIDSAVVLISGFAKQLTDLQAQLAAAIAGNDPVAIQAVADSLAATAADVTAKKATLAAAVASGTTSAPAPTPPPPAA